MRCFSTSAALACCALGCQSLDRFDTTKGGAYCGHIESSQFIWTPPAPAPAPPDEGGFDRRLRLKLELDTAHLNTVPGFLTTDDGDLGPCTPNKTFDRSSLRVTSEVVHDSLSLMTFEDGQVHNIISWVDSTCRGKMLAVVSLYSPDRVEVRLLKPAPSNATSPGDAFALFPLTRADNGCGDY
jgi:hypothetical protein